MYFSFSRRSQKIKTHIEGARVLLTILPLTFITSFSALADGVPGTVSTDLFDSTQGTTIIGQSINSDTPAISAFSTTGTFENGHVLMTNGAIDSISFIEFDTATDAEIRGVRLFARNDGAAFGFRRAMNNFRLLADRDGDGSYEFEVVNSAITVNYANQANNIATDPNNLDLTIMSSEVVRSRLWRLEVSQGTNIQPFEGARLVELDAIAASCDIVPGVSTDDVFDISQGTTVVNHDTIEAPENALSTCSGFENGHALMRNGGIGSVSFINYVTPIAVSIEGIRLFAHNDGAVNAFRRAMNNFRLLAD